MMYGFIWTRYRNFECKPQRYQLYNIFSFSMEEVFETLETAVIDMTTTRPSNMIESIINRNFVNTFHHQNVPNLRQRVHKHADQNYKSSSFQTPKNFSHLYLRENKLDVETQTTQVMGLFLGGLQASPVS